MLEHKQKEKKVLLQDFFWVKTYENRPFSFAFAMSDIDISIEEISPTTKTDILGMFSEAFGNAMGYESKFSGKREIRVETRLEQGMLTVIVEGREACWSDMRNTNGIQQNRFSLQVISSLADDLFVSDEGRRIAMHKRVFAA